MNLHLFFLVVALVLFGVAAVGFSPARGNLVAAGLFFATLSQVWP